MNFELRKYNIEQVKKALSDVKGKTIMLNDTWLYEVISIDIEEAIMHNEDPVPDENYDGGKVESIVLIFNFENGKVCHGFCLDIQHCEIMIETEDLWVFRIQPLQKYLESKIFDLQFQLNEIKKER